MQTDLKGKPGVDTEEVSDHMESLMKGTEKHDTSTAAVDPSARQPTDQIVPSLFLNTL